MVGKRVVRHYVFFEAHVIYFFREREKKGS